MKELSIDIETYSPIDLARRGVYKYAEHPDFSILLFGYAVDDGEVKVVDLAKGERIPHDILLALTDPLVTKWAFNASFERICLSRYLREHYPSHFLSYGSEGDTIGKYLDPLSWKCSQVLASSLGFPLSLKDLGEALGLSEKKMDEGSRLIGLFSLPGPEGRRMPEGYLEEWALFKKYNRRDVEVERAVRRSFSSYKTPAVLWDEYHEDQRINDRGIPVDIPFVHAAMAMGDRAQMELLGRLKHLTGLLNPKSPCQMKDWLSANGTHAESLCIDANEFPVIPFPDIIRIINDLYFIAAELVIMIRRAPGIASYSPLLTAVNRGRCITADGGRNQSYYFSHFSLRSFPRALGRRLDGVGV